MPSETVFQPSYFLFIFSLFVSFLVRFGFSFVCFVCCWVFFLGLHKFAGISKFYFIPYDILLSSLGLELFSDCYILPQKDFQIQLPHLIPTAYICSGKYIHFSGPKEDTPKTMLPGCTHAAKFIFIWLENKTDSWLILGEIRGF